MGIYDCEGSAGPAGGCDVADGRVRKAESIIQTPHLQNASRMPQDG